MPCGGDRPPIASPEGRDVQDRAGHPFHRLGSDHRLGSERSPADISSQLHWEDAYPFRLVEYRGVER